MYKYLKELGEEIHDPRPPSFGEDLHAQNQEDDLSDDPRKQNQRVDDHRDKHHRQPQIAVCWKPRDMLSQVFEVQMWW